MSDDEVLFSIYIDVGDRSPSRCPFGNVNSRPKGTSAGPEMQREEFFSLIMVVDDATKQVLYAKLVDAEGTVPIFEALGAVFCRYGLPQTLYSDRASWAARTPVKDEPVDKTRPTQVGRALKRLGVEHILAYSPQARGRSERVNRTFQGRLVNELRIEGVRSIDAANRYLADRFVPGYNLEFARPPADPTCAFISLGGVDLDQVLCFEEERVVQRDNTVGCEGVCSPGAQTKRPNYLRRASPRRPSPSR